MVKISSFLKNILQYIKIEIYQALLLKNRFSAVDADH